MKIIEDERKWRVTITFDKEDCPYRYYPDSRIGCTEMLSENECTVENCPHISQLLPDEADHER